MYRREIKHPPSPECSEPTRGRVAFWALSMGILLSGSLLSVGCAQEMNDQPRLEALDADPLLRDADRQPPEHTVPMEIAAGSSSETSGGLSGGPSGGLSGGLSGGPSEESGLRSGREEGNVRPMIPPRWNDPEELAAVLHRGQSRFEIFCAPCHGLTGTGYGMVPQRGFPFPPSYHTPRLRSKPLGYIFAVATRGRGRMPPYGELLSTEDRWAVAAYVRTLQLSQYTPAEWLNPSERPQVELQQVEQP